MTRRVIVSADTAQLTSQVAGDWESFVCSWLRANDDVIHIALTGGRTGIAALQAIADATVSHIDWTRVHVWWSDERWLPAGDAERNDEQARRVFLERIMIPAENIHRMPARDSGLSLEDAAEAYCAELDRFSVNGWGHPAFGLVLLGVGPDGHIASLFPHRRGIEVVDRPAIAVPDSPKPPAERISLTRPVLNSAERVWMVLTGADKAAALGLTLAGASRAEVPAAGIKGREETVYYIDSAAATQVPADVTIRFAVGDQVGRD